MRREPDVFQEYEKNIEEQCEKGIIEKVDGTEEQPDGQTHYLPHQAVVRQDALTTKFQGFKLPIGTLF